jgi:nicotinate phosphoribosyltransferase
MALKREFSQALFADLYELTMAQAYWQHGQTGTATFSLFFRKYPHKDRAYFVFAGLADVLDYLEQFHFTQQDIDALQTLGLFAPAFLDYLGGLHFTGSVRAMREGTLFFVDEPVLEVTGPIVEAQIGETFVLNQVNLQSMLATKASRVLVAAQGRRVVDFGARRTHGLDAADKLARCSYLVGFTGTSNVAGALRYGIPPAGTMAHSFITSFPTETDAFRAYTHSFPDSTTLLVDTYDTLEGTKHAVAVAKEMRKAGHRLRAIRLDSGDILELSRRCRKLLDDAGLHDVQVFASGGLDEVEVDQLVSAGAPIDGFGVGTKLGVSADAPYTDCAYKLVQYAGQPVLKLSTGKQTLPGPKQVYRTVDAQDRFVGDVIARAEEPPPTAAGHPLLYEVMRRGRRVGADPTLNALREEFAGDFARFPDQHKAIVSPTQYPVAISPALERLHQQVVQHVIEKELGE